MSWPIVPLHSDLKGPHNHTSRPVVVGIHIPGTHIGTKLKDLPLGPHVPLEHGLTESELNTNFRRNDNQLFAGDAVEDEVNMLPTDAPKYALFLPIEGVRCLLGLMSAL